MRFKFVSLACFVVGCSSPDAVVEAGSADAADATRAPDSPMMEAAVDASDAGNACADASCSWASELSPKNPACKPCMACHCCSELKDCFGSANECKALFDCLKSCSADAGPDGGAAACQQACLQDHQAGLPIANGFAKCAEDKCSSECL
jgi:hypothetical protein